jgi:hypothetical protein
MSLRSACDPLEQAAIRLRSTSRSGCDLPAIHCDPLCSIPPHPPVRLARIPPGFRLALRYRCAWVETLSIGSSDDR